MANPAHNVVMHLQLDMSMHIERYSDTGSNGNVQIYVVNSHNFIVQDDGCTGSTGEAMNVYAYHLACIFWCIESVLCV